MLVSLTESFINISNSGLFLSNSTFNYINLDIGFIIVN